MFEKIKLAMKAKANASEKLEVKKAKSEGVQKDS